MFTFKRAGSLTVLSCIIAIALTTAAEPPNFTSIEYPNAQATYALGINPQGDIVGGFFDQTGEHAFVLRKGEFTAFDWPGALWTDAYGINARGDIVGQYGWYNIAKNTTTVQGFLLSGGVFYPVEVAGQQNNMPFKINPDGLIVGCNHRNTSNSGGTDMSSMTGFSTYLFGIAEHTMSRSMNLGVNPNGDVVGYYFGTPAGIPSTRAEWSYVVRNGEFTFFQYPEAFATLATDINARGTIVGRYRLATPAAFHGFILEKSFHTFDFPGATQTLPFGISARGDVVGYYITGTGNTAVYRGFLMSRNARE